MLLSIVMVWITAKYYFSLAARTCQNLTLITCQNLLFKTLHLLVNVSQNLSKLNIVNGVNPK